METHRSERRLASFRDLLAELAIITAGVLIALLLGGLVGWFDHRALAREARTNITREIRDNLGGSGRFAYIDTEPRGGVTIELLWNYRA